eukprot:gene978-1063_t
MFRIQILEQRLSAHEECAPELDLKLSNDPRLKLQQPLDPVTPVTCSGLQPNPSALPAFAIPRTQLKARTTFNLLL